MLASGIIVRLLGLLVVMGMVAAAVAVWRRLARNPLFLPAAKRKTGPLGTARIVCGVLGGLLVIGMVFGTWQTVRRSYAQIPMPAGQTIRVPTRAVSLEEMGYSILADGSVEVNDVRLLADVLVMDARCPEIRPVHVEQFDIRYLRQSPQINVQFRLDGHLCTYFLNVSGIHRADLGPRADAKDVTLRATGYQSISWTDLFRHPMSSSESISRIGTEANMMWVPIDGPRSPLSVTPLTPPHYFCLTLLTPVAADDPLRTVPIEEFVQSHKDVLLRSGIYGAMYTAVESDIGHVPAGVLRLGAYLGMAMLLLPAAAILLAQVFRRRDLATVGLILGLMLCVVVSERVLVARNVSRLADPGAPLQVRLVAASRAAAASFFFRDTAGQDLRTLAGTADLPPMVKRAIDGAIERLTPDQTRS